MINKFAIFSLCATSAIALNAADTKLDTTVITATGFESPLKDETRNVSIITADEIQGRGYASVQEILEKVPSVTFVNPGFGDTVDLRGQGSKANTSVKVLINGIGLNMLDTAHAVVPINMINVDDIERIEVIPGGGSVLYGGGTAGGVINIITKQKPEDFFANISAKFGSYSHRSTNLALGVKATDDLYLKFNAKAFSENGYRYNERNRGYYTSGSAIYQITDTQNITLNTNYYSSKIDTTSSITKEELNNNRKAAGSDKTFQKDRQLDISLDYSIKPVDELEIRIMPYYQKIKMTPDIFSSYVTYGLFEDEKKGVKTKGRYDYGSGEFVAGYEYEKNDGARSSIMDMNMPTGGRYHNDINVDITKNTHSIYALQRHEFNSWFSLGAGVRYEWADYTNSRTTNVNMTTNGMPPRPINTTDSIQNNTDINTYAFEITPNFKYSDTGNVYLKFERGFISPSPVQLTDKDQIKGYSFNNLKPEIFRTYEVGIKDLIFGQFSSATIFKTDTTDEIVYEELGGGRHAQAWRYYNLSKTRRYGLELYSEQWLFDQLKLSQTFSYINAQIKEGKDNGKRVPLVPRTKFVLGVDYLPIKKLTILSNFKYFDSTVDSNYDKIKDRFIVDIGTKYDFAKNISMSAGIKNLFNERYNTYQNKKQNSYIPAPERNFYAEFKYTF
ncbi:TonB-dependent receptor [Campylobacter sp. CX2-8023-23]|uniref:TonB-dependent receptor n=1 Tax=Campylobacter porcelli TaxID=1660073 RepID=UPI002E9AE549|nr:TonB-dependent receptor [Campylobacter sp. CX2-8023-23]